MRGGLHPPRADGNGWEYSQHAAKLAQEYKSKHGWVFNAINADPDSGFEGLELETALKHLSEEQRLAQLKATKAWLKATPAARKPLVSKFSKLAAEEAVKALCAALGDAASGKKKPAPPVSLESVSRFSSCDPSPRARCSTCTPGAISTSAIASSWSATAVRRR